MSEILYGKHKLSSFDKSYSAEVYIKNPNEYKELEINTSKAENLITRGGGYSYVAASFKKEILSLGMKNFSRILHFDKRKDKKNQFGTHIRKIPYLWMKKIYQTNIAPHALNIVLNIYKN